MENEDKKEIVKKKFMYLKPETHKGMKSLAAQDGKSLQEYVDRVLTLWIMVQQ